jgi:FKBP-type peptidyl-prolyl cis-trans isomerase 2
MKAQFAAGLVLLLAVLIAEGRAEELAVADGLEVSFEYTLSLSDKTVVASNIGQEPVTYVHGRKQIVPGLEKAMAGLKPGQSKHVDVPSAEAYGAYDEKARITVGKSQVPPNVKAGAMLSNESGQPVKVLEVSDEKVVIDLNHPLAGKDLVFDVKVVKVEKEKVAPAAPVLPQ